MADYKEIVGTRVKAVSANPSDALDGEVWYNSTDAALNYKKANVAGAWSSGGNLNTGRYYMNNAGIQTAAFGAGGYTRALLEAGAEKVISIDRDPQVFDLAKTWVSNYPDKIQLHNDKFSNLGKYGSDLDGIVLDLGLSSMQVDEASRGFSFIKDGPLAMRMSKSGPSAADLVNTSAESEIANILYFLSLIHI